MSEQGHNSTNPELRAFVERIERVQDEIDAARGDQKEVYMEAKGRGYDVKALRRIVALRKKDREKLAEEKAVLETYGAALDMDVFL